MVKKSRKRIYNKNETTEYVEEFNEKYKKIGKLLSYALIKIKLQNLEKNQYAIVRKNLIIGTGENEKNFWICCFSILTWK